VNTLSMPPKLEFTVHLTILSDSFPLTPDLHVAFIQIVLVFRIAHKSGAKQFARYSTSSVLAQSLSSLLTRLRSSRPQATRACTQRQPSIRRCIRAWATARTCESHGGDCKICHEYTRAASPYQEHANALDRSHHHSTTSQH